MTTSSIYDAISDENMPALEQWIKDGFADDLEDGGYTPLLHAVDQGNLDACKVLIAAGADVNAKYESATTSNLHLEEGIETRCTPLSLSIYWDHYDIARMLIEAGADVNETIYVTVPTACGGEEVAYDTSCFEMVSKSDDNELLDLFFYKGADPDVENGEGETAIIKAIKHGDLERFKKLLEWGADPAQPCDGWHSGNLISLTIEEYCNSRIHKDTYLEMLRMLLERGGLSKLKYYSDDLLSFLFFEVNDPRLDKLFDLDGIREHVAELKAELDEEIKTPHGLCPRTLLSPIDSDYRSPRSCDIHEVFALVQRKYDYHAITKMLDCDALSLDRWLNGEADMPYPTWHLLIRIALSHRGVPAPV